jgi:beta-lactamase regulating signal transducer with metallopeptidase domain
VNDLLSIAVSNAVAATILALVAFVVGAVYRRPALVHGLWLLVLLKLVTPPLLLIPVAWPTASEVVPVEEEPPLVTQEAPAAIVVLPSAGDEKSPALEPPALVDSLPDPSLGTATDSPRWPQVGAIIWIAGSLVWFLLALTRLYRFRRLLRFARPAPAAL